MVVMFLFAASIAANTRCESRSSNANCTTGRGRQREGNGRVWLPNGAQQPCAPRRLKRALRATWGGIILAESNNYLFLDGRHYFPPESILWRHLERNGHEGYRNPYGRFESLDIVSPLCPVRARSGVQVFQSLRRPWHALSGYASFRNGVRIKEVWHENSAGDGIEPVHKSCFRIADQEWW